MKVESWDHDRNAWKFVQLIGSDVSWAVPSTQAFAQNYLDVLRSTITVVATFDQWRPNHGVSPQKSMKRCSNCQGRISPEIFPPSMSMMTMMSSGDSRLMACHHIPQLDQDQPLGHDQIGGPLGYYLHAVRITLASVHRLMQMPELPPLFEKKDSTTIWAENIEYIRPQKIVIAILLICTNKTSI